MTSSICPPLNGAAFDVEALAAAPLSGGQIELVIHNTAFKVAVREESIFTMQDFQEEISKELGSSFDGEKSMGFRVGA